MSWFSSNYEKAMLGGGAVIALGAAWMGWSQLSAVDADFSRSLKGSGDDNAAVTGAERVDRAMSSLKLDHGLQQGITPDGRKVDLFVGIPLFVERDNPSRTIDVVKGSNIHEGIPNSFWIENQIDPGFGDAPERDPDGDGFSNREEFQAKTDPNNAKSHPELIRKLRYVGDDSLTWVLQPSFGNEGQFPIKYGDSERRTNKAPAGEGIKPGEVFFANGAAKGRFKLLSSEVRSVMNEAISAEEDITFLKIEDQKPNKKGMVYEFPSPLTDSKVANYTQYDRKAVLRLEALGLEGNEFSVEEYTAFSLPADGADKGYQLKKVTPEEVVVVYRGADGQTHTVTIPKGQLPTL